MRLKTALTVARWAPRTDEAPRRLAAILALGSWLTSNLGGFVIGLLLALVGSALAFAWTPRKGPAARIASREDAAPENAAPENASPENATREQTPDGPSPEEELIDHSR